MVAKSIVKSNSKSVQRISSAKSHALKKKKGGVSKSRIRSKSKSTKHQIDKLNSDLNEIDEIQQLLRGDSYGEKKINPLDTKSLKDGLKADEENRAKDKAVENDIKSQMDMIAEMGF